MLCVVFELLLQLLIIIPRLLFAIAFLYPVLHAADLDLILFNQILLQDHWHLPDGSVTCVIMHT